MRVIQLLAVLVILAGADLVLSGGTVTRDVVSTGVDFIRHVSHDITVFVRGLVA